MDTFILFCETLAATEYVRQAIVEIIGVPIHLHHLTVDVENLGKVKKFTINGDFSEINRRLREPFTLRINLTLDDLEKWVLCGPNNNIMLRKTVHNFSWTPSPGLIRFVSKRDTPSIHPK